jgi:protein kinase A
MPFMEGGTLSSLLGKMKRLPETMARVYAAEIIVAVSFLHKLGIVHR